MFKEDAIKMIRIAQQKPKRENLVERESRGKRKRNDVHKNESVCLMFPSICNILYTRIIMSFYTI